MLIKFKIEVTSNDGTVYKRVQWATDIQDAWKTVLGESFPYGIADATCSGDGQTLGFVQQSNAELWDGRRNFQVMLAMAKNPGMDTATKVIAEWLRPLLLSNPSGEDILY